ncbi:MAG TPA: hypothetical protein VKV24_15920 [Casimicrobiaceae bacterium]|nr:hypothetical protein [Casimicrobiaceae bacterium]
MSNSRHLQRLLPDSAQRKGYSRFAMDDPVDFADLLAALDNRALRAMIATVDQMPAVVPSLIAWLDHAAHWEYDRRHGDHYPLQIPMHAIPDDELAAALDASALIGQCFRLDRRDDLAPVIAFFEGLAKTLAAEHARVRLPLN